MTDLLGDRSLDFGNESDRSEKTLAEWRREFDAIAAKAFSLDGDLLDKRPLQAFVQETVSIRSLEALALRGELNRSPPFCYLVTGNNEDDAVPGANVQTRVFSDRRLALDFAGSLDECEIQTWKNGECVLVEDALDVAEFATH